MYVYLYIYIYIFVSISVYLYTHLEISQYLPRTEPRTLAWQGRLVDVPHEKVQLHFGSSCSKRPKKCQCKASDDNQPMPPPVDDLAPADLPGAVAPGFVDLEANPRGPPLRCEAPMVCLGVGCTEFPNRDHIVLILGGWDSSIPLFKTSPSLLYHHLPFHGCKNGLSIFSPVKNGLEICFPCGTRPKSTLESTTPWPPCARCSSWAAKQGFGWRSPVPCWALRCERWWRSNFQSNQVPRPPRW